jgi:uncharacterized protein
MRGPTVAGRPVALAVAKAPVPGLVKTRLAAAVGDEAAALLAAAALLDTIDACEAAFGADRCHLALDGDLADAVDGAAIAGRLRRWTLTPQRGDGFGERLAGAHADAAGHGDGGIVVQVGMDTPQVPAAVLREVAALGAAADAVLGPAEDGGWWVLGLTAPGLAQALTGVEMSTERTGADTEAALRSAGARVARARRMRDVDDHEDAVAVATAAPGTRFARCWWGLSR